MEKHFTESVPVELGLKLQQAGMPVRIHFNPNRCDTTYADAIDLLMERGVNVCVTPRWRFSENRVKDWLPVVNGTSYDFCDDWHEAAVLAIEKALETLNQQKNNK